MELDGKTLIDICVCTFRRQHLAATLRSLANLEVPESTHVRILIADNDTVPSALPLVSQLEKTALPIEYLHAPERNISVARNACLDHATGDLVAWIDDDETADPRWLVRLLEAMRDGGFDAVFGPAIAIYPTDTPDFLVQGDFHSNRPVMRRGEVRTGHTCNALVDMRRAVTRDLRFDISKGRTGGEDTDYFYRLWTLGGKLGICDSAHVFEQVVPSRLRFSWLVRRSFNAGHVFGELSRRRVGATAIVTHSGVALAKAAYCLVAATINGASSTKRLWWARRSVMHIGVAAGLLKFKARAQY